MNSAGGMPLSKNWAIKTRHIFIKLGEWLVTRPCLFVALNPYAKAVLNFCQLIAGIFTAYALFFEFFTTEKLSAKLVAGDVPLGWKIGLVFSGLALVIKPLIDSAVSTAEARKEMKKSDVERYLLDQINLYIRNFSQITEKMARHWAKPTEECMAHVATQVAEWVYSGFQRLCGTDNLQVYIVKVDMAGQPSEQFRVLATFPHTQVPGSELPLADKDGPALCQAARTCIKPDKSGPTGRQLILEDVEFEYSLARNRRQFSTVQKKGSQLLVPIDVYPIPPSDGPVGHRPAPYIGFAILICFQRRYAVRYYKRDLYIKIANLLASPLPHAHSLLEQRFENPAVFDLRATTKEVHEEIERLVKETT